jgi:hypothetical protein
MDFSPQILYNNCIQNIRTYFFGPEKHIAGRPIEELSALKPYTGLLDEYRELGAGGKADAQNLTVERYPAEITIDGHSLDAVCGRSLHDLVYALRSLEAHSCGKFHERDGISPEKCVLREGNLSCGHPEYELTPLLRGSIWLARELGALSPKEAQALWTKACELTEGAGEDHPSLRSVDRRAQREYLREAPDEYARPSIDHPGNTKTFADVSREETLVGDALKKNVVDALVTAFEHVIDPESGMRENIASEAERNKRRIAFIMEHEGAFTSPEEDMSPKHRAALEEATAKIANATTRQERRAALGMLKEFAGTVAFHWSAINDGHGNVTHVVMDGMHVMESLLGHTLPERLFNDIIGVRNVADRGVRTRAYKYAYVAKLLKRHYLENGFDPKEADERSKRGATDLFDAGFFTYDLYGHYERSS